MPGHSPALAVLAGLDRAHIAQTSMNASRNQQSVGQTPPARILLAPFLVPVTLVTLLVLSVRVLILTSASSQADLLVPTTDDALIHWALSLVPATLALLETGWSALITMSVRRTPTTVPPREYVRIRLAHLFATVPLVSWVTADHVSISTSARRVQISATRTLSAQTLPEATNAAVTKDTPVTVSPVWM
jgi:hypothetical protein